MWQVGSQPKTFDSSLSLTQCPHSPLAELFEDISTLSALEVLRVCGCPKVKALPRGIGALLALKTLDIFDLSKLNQVSGVGSKIEIEQNRTNIQPSHVGSGPMASWVWWRKRIFASGIAKT